MQHNETFGRGVQQLGAELGLAIETLKISELNQPGLTKLYMLRKRPGAFALCSKLRDAQDGNGEYI